VKCYQAEFVDSKHPDKPDEHAIHVFVAAQSLGHAARKAEELANTNGKGELTSVTLTDQIII